MLYFRDPYTHFVSSWKYYNGLIIDLRKKLKSYNEKEPDFIAEISEFLIDPEKHIKAFPFSHRKRSTYKYNSYTNTP